MDVIKSTLYIHSHLEDTHPVCVSQDLVGLIVVAVTDICGGNEQLKGVIFLQVQSSRLNLLLQLAHPFLTMTDYGQLKFGVKRYIIK